MSGWEIGFNYSAFISSCGYTPWFIPLSEKDLKRGWLHWETSSVRRAWKRRRKGREKKLSCGLSVAALRDPCCWPLHSNRQQLPTPSIAFESVNFTLLRSVSSYDTCSAVEKHIRPAHRDLPRCIHGWFGHLQLKDIRPFPNFFKIIGSVAVNQAVHASLHMYVQDSQPLSLIATSHLPSLGKHMHTYMHIWKCMV